ncbi:hypothetical protein C1N53_21445 [Pontibacter sp. SGAir0037]|nr:hypothetical protein C1N53_21445 [Pontibacter sp. SGAir0037]
MAFGNEPVPLLQGIAKSHKEATFRQDEYKHFDKALADKVSVNLPQAVVEQLLLSFAFPTDQDVPACGALLEAVRLSARLFPVIIQPNAP